MRSRRNSVAPKKSTRTRRWNRCFTTYLIPNDSANGAVWKMIISTTTERTLPATSFSRKWKKPENYFRFKMQQMPQRVLYQDIEKGRELDARAKLQLFGGNIASPDLDRRIIRPPECIVKLRADTPQMETHGRETSRVRRESRDMASGRAALDAGRRAETARVTERHIDSNLK